MQIQSRLTLDRVKFDASTPAHLVLSLTAPPLAAGSRRQPVCVLMSIDVSPSMRGEKFRYAKQSVLTLIDHLQPGDYAGLVAFSNTAKVVCAPQLVTSDSKEALRAAVAQLTLDGGTNLADGLVKAIEAAKALDLPSSTLVRVLVLTDGQPNVGIAKTADEMKALVSASRAQVTVSAFGYGTDADQALLAGVAEAGAGNYAFVQNPDDALSAFGKELGGLLSTYAQNLVVDVRPACGHIITEVVSDFDVEEEVTGEVSIRAPSLLAEETLHLVLAVTFSPQKTAGPRLVNAFETRVSFETIGSDGGLERRSVESKARAQFVKPSEASRSAPKELDEIVARAQLVRVQAKAETAAKQGDHETSSRLFRQFSVDLAARGHESLVGVAAYVGGFYGGGDIYNATASNRVGLRAAMSRGVAASSLAAEDQAVLSAASYSISTSSQDALTKNFRETTPPSAPRQEDLAALFGAPAELEKVSASQKPLDILKRLAKVRSHRW
jgi:Ca-activated chloride channel homolog